MEKKKSGNLRQALFLIAVSTGMIFVAYRIAPVPSSFVGSDGVAELAGVIKIRLAMFFVAFALITFCSVYSSKKEKVGQRQAFRFSAALSLAVALGTSLLFPFTIDIRAYCNTNGYKGTRGMQTVSFVRDMKKDLKENHPIEITLKNGDYSLDVVTYTVSSGRSGRLAREYVFNYGGRQALISKGDYEEMSSLQPCEAVTVKYYNRSGLLESVEWIKGGDGK